MSERTRKVLALFTWKRIMIPIVIGIGITAFLIIKDLKKGGMDNWSVHSVNWYFLACSILMVISRDLAYIYRIWLMTDKKISFRRAFEVIMLWEFSSSVTPGVVGGAAAAVFIINGEGFSFGKSTAIVLTCSFLDDMFYVIMVPLVLLIAGTSSLKVGAEFSFFSSSFGTVHILIIGYTVIFFIALVIFYGIFLRPRGFKWIILNIFRISFLRKWRYKASKTGDDMILTSKEMKGKPIDFWVKTFGATLFSWTARYLTVNFLILAFVAGGDQAIIFARQLIMWVILLVSPTPGSSGIAELGFREFLGEFTPAGFSGTLALLWRLISYYPYILIGSLVLPVWLKRVIKQMIIHKQEKTV